MRVNHSTNDLLKTILKMCQSCVGNEKFGIRSCDMTHCELWPFRRGIMPTRKEIALHLGAKRKFDQEMKEADRLWGEIRPQMPKTKGDKKR